MLGVLGLLTGWALLMPLVVLLLTLVGVRMDWMIPFLGIAASAPMLGFCTAGGIGLIAWSVGNLAKPKDDDLTPGR